MQIRRVRRILLGLASAAFGVVLVFGSILIMNGFAATAEPSAGSAESSVAFERKEKPPQQQQVRHPEPPPRAPRRAPAPPSLGLDSGLSGLDFGLPSFDADDLAALSGSLLGGSGDVIMTDDSVDVPPRPAFQAPMRYPVRAKAQGVTGYVILSVLIGPTGQVERVKVLESHPTGVFDDTAVAGVQGWRFEPASYRGENVRVWARQRVSFNLS